MTIDLYVVDETDVLNKVHPVDITGNGEIILHAHPDLDLELYLVSVEMGFPKSKCIELALDWEKSRIETLYWIPFDSGTMLPKRKFVRAWLEILWMWVDYYTPVVRERLQNKESKYALRLYKRALDFVHLLAVSYEPGKLYWKKFDSVFGEDGCIAKTITASPEFDIVARAMIHSLWAAAKWVSKSNAQQERGLQVVRNNYIRSKKVAARVAEHELGWSLYRGDSNEAELQRLLQPYMAEEGQRCIEVAIEVISERFPSGIMVTS